MKRVMLIMDDQELDAIIMKQLHDSSDLFIKTYSRGEDALGELSRSHYDVVFVSSRLPDIGGEELLKEIRTYLHQEPLILILRDRNELCGDGVFYECEDIINMSEIESSSLRVHHLMHRLMRQRSLYRHFCEEHEECLSIFNSLNEGIYVVDPETYTILKANAAAIRILGENPIGKKCYEVLLEGSTAPCVHCDNAILSRGVLQSGELPWEFKSASNNEWYRCISKGITWSDRKFAKMEVIENITESRKVDREINMLCVFKDKIRSLPNVAVIEFDKMGKISYTNQATINLLGCSRKEIENQFVWKFLDERGKEAWFQLLNEVSPRDSDSIECVVVAKERKIEAFLNIIFNRDIKDKLVDGLLFIVEKVRKEVPRYY